jgi:hypothetical protein
MRMAKARARQYLPHSTFRNTAFPSPGA